MLERKISRPKKISSGNPFLACRAEVFSPTPASLPQVGFEADETGQLYRVSDSPAARDALQKLGIEPAVQHEAGPDGMDQDRKEQLESVKRWYTATGKISTKSCKHQSSKEFPSFSRSLTTIPASSGRFVRRRNCTGTRKRSASGRKPLPPIADSAGAGKDHCA